MNTERTAEQLVELVRELLRLPHETPWLEYKQNNADPSMIGECVSALSNSAALDGKERGYILWGVQDGSRSIVGTSFAPFAAKVGNEDLRNWLLRLLTPQVHFEFFETAIEGQRVVLLEIAHAAHQPVRFMGVDYIRVGSHKKKLKDHADYARRLWKAFDKTPFESGAALDRVSSEDVLRLLDYPAYFELMGMALPEQRAGILDALAADGLIVPLPAARWVISNLGAVLFARRLEAFPSLGRKALRVVQYRGKNRIKTIKEQVSASGYANGFQIILEYINGLLPSNEIIGQALRETVRMYPDLAVRELVANALIHQDFSLTGTGPLVEIFDDRIEITNPGVPLVEPNRFIDSPPRSRNEGLASAMRRMGMCEERGSGWDKIGFEIEVYQLPAPLVEVTGEHTRVTLFSYRELREMDRDDRVRAVYLHAALRHVARSRVTNTSIRERFKIDVRNSAKASRLIRDAVDAGVIVPRDPQAARKFMEYVPYWAA